MPHLRPALVLLAAVSGATLTASNPVPWIAVLKSLPDGVEVVARLVPTARGAELEFMNRGNRAIHFDFHLPGSQTPKDAEGNRRIHLRPGKSSGAVEYPVPDHGVQGLPVALKFQHIRLGVDAGAFWRD